MFKVYDKVWIMENNQPKQKMIFAVVESMAFLKKGTETHYRLVDGTFGAGWGNNEGIRREAKDMFSTKSELLESLAA